MKNKISIKDFFDKHGFDKYQKEQFNVYRREDFGCHEVFLKYTRRDFYKIMLIVEGEGVLATANKGIKIRGNALSFMNPMIPYSWEPISREQSGYFCIFTEEFINMSVKNKLISHSALFEIGSNQVFFLTNEQTLSIKNLFENMLKESKSDYKQKYELLRNYVKILLHEGLKMEPPTTYFKLPNSADRISSMFNDLLDQQYKIDYSHQKVTLKSAQEYADRLMIHVNHLNKTLKKTFGKSTTQLIADRTAIEAKSLLLSTNWDIGQISYCLGFEHLSNFNRFFKKQFEMSPSELRSSEYYFDN